MGLVIDDNELLCQQGSAALDPERDLFVAPQSEHDADVRALQQRRLSHLHDRLVTQLYDRIEGREVPIATPWATLNRALGGGLWPGLHVLTGATGTGKSQWVLQVTETACRAQVPVLYVGLELDPLSLFTRLLGLRARCQWSALYHGEDRGQIVEVLRHHGPELITWPLYVETAPPMGWDHGNLYHRVETLRAVHASGPLLILVDYLQLVAGQERELRERIRLAAYGSRAAARDFGAAVLLISSVAREHYRNIDGSRLCSTEEPEPPTRFVGLGKESGEIEYAADTVLAMCRDPKADRIDLAIAKLRAGRPNWIALRFDGGRFSELTDRDDTTRELQL